MKKYRVKIKFNFFNAGDIVGETEYSKYGPQYFELVEDKKEDIVDYTEQQNDETPAGDNQNAETETTDSGDTAETESTETETTSLDEMSYPELKARATELGLEYSGNISKKDLIELIKNG